METEGHKNRPRPRWREKGRRADFRNGSISEIGQLPGWVRLSLDSGHAATAASCQFRANLGSVASPHHLVGDRQHCCRKFETERRRGSSIEYQLEFGLLLEGDFARRRTSQHLSGHASKAAH